MTNHSFDDLKSNVQQIIDLIAAKKYLEASDLLLEVSEKLDEFLDYTDEDEDLMQLSHYQVLLNKLHLKIDDKLRN